MKSKGAFGGWGRKADVKMTAFPEGRTQACVNYKIKFKQPLIKLVTLKELTLS